MLQDRSRVESIAERVGPDSFRHPHYREIFATLLDAGDSTFESLSATLDPDAIETAQDLLGDGPSQMDVQRTIDDSITRLHVREMEDRLSQIDSLLPIANEREKESLQEERQKLVVQMRASGKMAYKAFRRGRSR
jgi:hypothetical protein